MLISRSGSRCYKGRTALIPRSMPNVIESSGFNVQELKAVGSDSRSVNIMRVPSPDGIETLRRQVKGGLESW